MTARHARTGSYRLPAAATTHLPGTIEKLAVMAQRVEDGTSLFHPDDARDDDTTAGLPVELSLVLSSDRQRRPGQAGPRYAGVSCCVRCGWAELHTHTLCSQCAADARQRMRRYTRRKQVKS